VVFETEEEIERREQLYLYFSVEELWLMTKPWGLKAVWKRFLIDVSLLCSWMVALILASCWTMAFAVRDYKSGNKQLKHDVIKAQYGAQIMVALVMVYSLMAFFQIGRIKGMMFVRRQEPEDVAFQVSGWWRTVVVVVEGDDDDENDDDNRQSLIPSPYPVTVLSSHQEE